MKNIKPTILVIDDEPQIRKILKLALEAHGYNFNEADNGEKGLVLAAQNPPDLIILDLGLPDIDGQEVLVKLKKWFIKPVIILTVRNDDENIVRALDNDAIDYVRKPFSLVELLARIKSALKKGQKSDVEPNLIFNHLKIDLNLRRIFFNDEEVNLSTTEYELLKLFALNAGKILTHSHILKTIWGPNAEKQGQYLRVYVNHLRHKIEIDPSRPVLLINEPGVGYRFGQ